MRARPLITTSVVLFTRVVLGPKSVNQISKLVLRNSQDYTIRTRSTSSTFLLTLLKDKEVLEW